MNLQEREQLNIFLHQLTQVQASQKDTEADALIREACARQPDAGYLLVQRAMQLEHALQTMQAQISQLQAELAQARSGTQTSFLNDVNAWGRQATTPAPSAPASAPTSPFTIGSAIQSRAQAPASVPAPATTAGAASSWGSGIMGNVATTAAGVVAGSFLYQGIQNMMGHHNQGDAGWTNSGAHAAPPVAENTVINNYYDSSGPSEAVDVADASSDFGDTDSA
jgi:uncharacterized protein